MAESEGFEPALYSLQTLLLSHSQIKSGIKVAFLAKNGEIKDLNFHTPTNLKVTLYQLTKCFCTHTFDF
jgi:hypothetical protein